MRLELIQDRKRRISQAMQQQRLELASQKVNLHDPPYWYFELQLVLRYYQMKVLTLQQESKSKSQKPQKTNPKKCGAGKPKLFHQVCLAHL